MDEEIQGEKREQVLKEFSSVEVKNNTGKLSTRPVIDLTNPKNKEILANMMVDFKTAAHEMEVNAIKQVLSQEFGNSIKFSDDFIAKVQKRLKQY